MSKSVNLLLLPFLTSFFTTEEYGVIDIIATLTSLAGLFMTLSLESAVMRFWNDAKRDNNLSSLISGSLIIVAIVGLVTFLLALIFSDAISNLLLEAPSAGIYVTLGICSSVFMASKSVPLIALRMQRKIYHFNWVNIVQTVLYMSITLLLIYTFDLGLMGVFLGTVISQILSLILGLVLVRNFFTLSLNWDFLKPSLRYSLPMLPAVFVTWLNSQVDRYMLLFFLGLGSVGVFGASARIVTIVTLLVTVFRQAWAPLSIDALDEDENKRNSFYSRGLNYYMLIMFSIAVILVLLSKTLLGILVSEEFRSGFVVIPFLLGAKIMHGAASFTNLGTVINKKTAINSIAAFVGFSCNVGLGLWLIPKYDIAGAAMGSFVAEFLFFAILWVATVRNSSVKFNTWLVGSILLFYVAFCYLYLNY